MTKIFAGGIPKSFTQDDFASYFKKFGHVNEASLIVKHGISRCFGFVKYMDPAVAKAVVGKIHRLEGKVITVKYSAPSAANFLSNPKRFWIGSIKENVISCTDLVNYFSSFGLVNDTFIVKGRGFGFVTITFHNPNSAKMVESHRKHPIKGEEVEVKPALPKKGETRNFRPEQRFDREFQAPKISSSALDRYSIKKKNLYYGTTRSNKIHSHHPQQPPVSSYSIATQPNPYLQSTPFRPTSSFKPQITTMHHVKNPPTILPLHNPPSLSEGAPSTKKIQKKRPPYRSVGKYESFGADPAPCTYEIPSPKKVKPAAVPKAEPSKFQYSIRTPLMPVRNLDKSDVLTNGARIGSATQPSEQRQTSHVSSIYSRSFQPY